MTRARIAIVLTCWAGLGTVSPAPPGDEPIPVEVEVISITRLDHSTQLVVELHNDGNSEVSILGLGDPAFSVGGQLNYNDLSGIHLLDVVANIEYLPYRDRERTLCVCSRFPLPMEEDETWTAWWRSAPLPDSVATVTVLGPNGEELATGVEVEG